MNERKPLKRDYFISRMMVGNCPNCGSDNTHDCEAPTFVVSPIVPFYEGEPKRIEKMGSECEVARKIDDITVGHCDDCGHIWCLECGNKLTLEKPVCGHWEICDGCDQAENLRDNQGNIIEDTVTCPFDADITQCPKIKRFLEKEEAKRHNLR